MAGFYSFLKRTWPAFLVVGIAVFGFAFYLSAQEPAEAPHEGEVIAEITFPVPELGNCGSEEECRVYCDDLSHKNECLEFAREHGLIAEEDIEQAEKLPPEGPGECKSKSECETYCSDPANGEECISFAEEHETLPPEEIAQIREEFTKTGPGGCRGTVECSAYCSQSENQVECLEFARREGHITEEQYARAQQSFQGGPGGCRGPDGCRAYCSESGHLNECLEFAEKEGLVSGEEVVRIKKQGIVEGPGGCKFEECRAYCEDPAHQAECIDFAEKNGLMTQEELTLAKKMIGKTGPGGCNGPRECEAYCSEPGNTETCLEFAAAEGFMPPEEIARARKFLAVTQQGGPGGCRGIECRDYCNNPANRDQCFEFAKSEGLIPPEELGKFEAGLKIHKKMQESGGPGGCRSEPECMAYCSDPSHVEECVAFGAAHGGLSDEEVRRMLKEFTEGRHGGPGDFRPPEDFRRFEEEARKRFEEFRQLEEQFRGGSQGGPEGFGPPSGFPGAPGQFPGAPGAFPAGGHGGFVGPGGCTSPAECIQYCIAHKDECFGSGGGPGFGPSGSFPDSGGLPQLRPDLIQPLSPSAPSFTPRSSGTLKVNITADSSSGFNIVIRSSNGIDEFSLIPAQGMIRNTAVYGGIVGCQPEFTVERLGLLQENFPLTVRVKDCGGNELKQEITSLSAGFSPEIPAAPPVQSGLVPPDALPCLLEIYGKDVVEKINRGELLPPTDFQEKLAVCIQKQFAPPAGFEAGAAERRGFFANLLEAFINIFR